MNQQELDKNIYDDVIESMEYGYFDRDDIAERADSLTPIYNGDIFELAADNINDFGLRVPDCGPAYDGEASPVNIIAANIYEYISNSMYDLLENASCPHCGAGYTNKTWEVKDGAQICPECEQVFTAADVLKG